MAFNINLANNWIPFWAREKIYYWFNKSINQSMHLTMVASLAITYKLLSEQRFKVLIKILYL